jgi:hypothetical protein
VADVGLEGTMKHMAGRKHHSAEDIVRKLRRAFGTSVIHPMNMADST